jgi:hypothetical protein
VDDVLPTSVCPTLLRIVETVRTYCREGDTQILTNGRGLDVFLVEDNLEIEFYDQETTMAESEWATRSTFDRGYQILEELGIGFPFLLRAAEREVEAVAERQEALELGIPLEEYSRRFPDMNPDVDAAKQKLLSEIRRLAASLPPRGRNWICGYLKSNFPELAGCFTTKLDPHDDAGWGTKLEEIINASLEEPSWPILLGRLYGGIVMVAQSWKD